MTIDGRLERTPGADDTDDGLRTPETDDLPGDAAGGPADGRRKGRRVAAWVTTGLACLLVLFAFNAPSDIHRLTPAAFVRIPLEGLLGVVLALVLPARARRVVAVFAGVALSLLAILKIVDMGFYEALDRPFHPVFDWPFIGAGVGFLTDSIGRAGAIVVVILAVVLIAALLTFMTLSVLRLSRLAVRHATAAAPAVAVLGLAWVTCAALGVQIVSKMPVAAISFNRVLQVPADLRDHETFAAKAAHDGFRATPGRQLLTALRGKDVIFSFVESYGRVAVANPKVDAMLKAGDRRLQAAGFASRSAFLTSPTFGGGSWLAHGTLLSGLWIDNQQRYNTLVGSNRLTLTKAFREANWRTVAVMPGNTKPWSEAAFYGDQRIYDHGDIGYRGPGFNWGTPPDQYTMAAFQRFERSTPHRAPVMAEIPLVSSHSPWAPTPHLIGWNDVGDGSVFRRMAAAADRPADVWRSATRVRAAYMRSVAYSLNTLISYVETYGDDRLVLVFLGDHQPAPLISGGAADRDVPITIVARDRAVLARISGWRWQDGLKPGPHAPVWRMDAFRDRFLSAFGPADNRR